MSASRNRVVMVAVVAAVALLAVGATAYAAEQGQSADTSTAGERTDGAGTSAVPTPSAPAPQPSPSASATTVPAPVSTQAAVEPEDVAVDSGVEGDGNVVEVRTPNPDAIPTTIAEREYFYGLVTQCMAEAGYDWQAVVTETNGSFSGVSFTHVGDIDPALQAGFTLALYGDTGSGDYYHWADAGCWGYAVHTTGNDGNN
ncbi:hypothetical protein E3T61_11320 [Cryobacterium lactosi]|uniref:Uncharacterized protein n=1 Tax=Cryobacterium lactosi TaxID=1259202 RepID=A0A4R9BS78_9MICO|nr:hypothetical protein [Cryobacterium lactosi]TFD89489.1 hypothetical protein E3T61_11320 [Cryobacterium lactosi]